MPRFLEVTDKAAAKAAVGFRTVYVEDYRDGIRTDDEIIEAAFDEVTEGGEIRFGGGVTYTLSEAFTYDLSATPNVTVNGQGAVIEAGDGIDEPMFVLSGELVGSTTLSTAITARTDTIVVGSTSGMEVGDLLRLVSSGEKYDSVTSGGGALKEEICRVKSVVNATTVTLDGRTWTTYLLGANTVTVDHLRPVKNLTVKDLTVRGESGLPYGSGLQVWYFDGAQLLNVRAEDFGHIGLKGFVGTNLTGIGCRAERMGVDSWPEGSVEGQNGYGFWSQGVVGVKWIGCYGSNNRRSFDCHASWDVLFQGCTAENDSSAGIGPHGMAYIKIVDCTVRGCGGGIIVRTGQNVIRGNHVYDVIIGNGQSYVDGIIVGIAEEQSGAAGYSGHDLIVENNVIDISGPAYLTTDSRGNGVRIQTQLVNARICGNIIKGVGKEGINWIGLLADHVDVSGNILDVSGQQNLSNGSVNEPAISFNPAGNGTATDLIIAHNQVSDGIPDNAIYVAGGANSGDRWERIKVIGNIATSCSGAATINLAGYFGEGIEVRDNITDPDIPAVKIITAYCSHPITTGDLSILNGVWEQHFGAGSNLASDPFAENPSLWAGDGEYSTDQALSGSRSIKLTADGGFVIYYVTSGRQSASQVKTEPGQIYLIQCWVYGKSTNVQVSGGDIRFQAAVDRAGTTSTTVNADFSADTSLNGQWTKLSAYLTMPALATAVDFRIMLRNNVTSDEVYYFDQIEVYLCGDQLQVAVPAAANSDGVAGQWAADSSYYYRCTATNTWRRVAIASW